jgi:hypothetical protein
MRHPIVAGNWKMHGSRTENARLIEELLVGCPARPRAACVICPPFVYLQEVARLLRDSAFSLGGQDVCADAQGAFTGEVSAAMLHNLPEEIAVSRMVTLLRPAGRLVIHDLRANSGRLDQLKSFAALAQVAAWRFLRTGRLRRRRDVREAYERHRAGETFLTLQQAQAMANRLLPDARVFHHWLWRYTIVWDKPAAFNT